MPGKYVNRVREFITPFLEQNGLSLVDVRFVSEEYNYYLRVFLDLSESEYERRRDEIGKANASRDCEGVSGDDGEADAVSDTEEFPDDEFSEEPGVSINDCVKVSRYLSKWLDKEDFIKETYTLEVCSRGFLE